MYILTANANHIFGNGEKGTNIDKEEQDVTIKPTLLVQKLSENGM